MHVTAYDPRRGGAFQGDVVILPLPKDVAILLGDEIPMRDGMLVLAEGEVTGHHHAIRYGLGAVARFHDEGLARGLAPAAGAKAPETAKEAAKAGRARLFRDPTALAALLRRKILTTGDLCIGFLLVEGECPPLTHDEHGAIAIPQGSYYVGRKREMQAADVRPVLD